MPKEYIEREAILNKSTYMFDEVLGHCKCVLVEDVGKIPSANVVEVVRCKGCQFGKYDDEQNMILCKRILNITDGEHFVYNKLDDFCSYGEREDKDK